MLDTKIREAKSGEKTKNPQFSFTKLGIKVALIFLIPALVVILIATIFHIRVLYLLPISFITSWILVIILYKRTSRALLVYDESIK